MFKLVEMRTKGRQLEMLEESIVLLVDCLRSVGRRYLPVVPQLFKKSLSFGVGCPSQRLNRGHDGARCSAYYRWRFAA